MRVLEKLKQWLVQRLGLAGVPTMTQRMYHMAKQSRLTQGFGNSVTSEDSEVASSLRIGRSRSRQLVRDAGYAKRAKVIVQNNIVGSGIGLQAQVMSTRGVLNVRINDEIETKYKRWSRKDSCHTGLSLCIEDFERNAMGQVFEAGEVFVRKYFRRFGNSEVPYALELIESERIADELAPAGFESQSNIRLGIEVDEFQAPMFYYIRTIHPGELRLNMNQVAKVEKVPASDIIHLRLIDRWPQTRSMPWMHAAARKLNDMDGLTEAEIIAARGAANYMGFIELPDGSRQYGEIQEDGSIQTELEPGLIERLKPGEKFNFAAPNRPNAQLDPFMRMMLREVAASVGCSYESLSRDYGQSNYSSSRLALIDDRDLWRVLQQWFVRDLRSIIHREWVQQAVLAGVLKTVNQAEYGANPEKFEAARFKLRGWSWIDPTKEVAAAKESVLAGFTTVSEVIAQTGSGRDLDDVVTEREQELALFKEKGLMMTTDPKTIPMPAAPTDEKKTDEEEEEDDASARAVERAESIARGHHA